MKKTQLPILATIIHDPNDRQVAPTKHHWQTLSSYFSAICISASDKVSDNLITFFKDHGATVKQSSRSIGQGRREAVEMALAEKGEYIQYCDFDRILHWVATYPQELELVASTIVNYDFLMLGRTDRAFNTHPKVQTVTESITNKAFSLAFGAEADVTAGSSAMNRQAAKIIIEHSKSTINDTDTEWPILMIEHGLQILPLLLNGLEFETPDYSQPEIEQAGSLENWLEETYNKPTMWQYRTNMTKQSVDRIYEYAKRTKVIKG